MHLQCPHCQALYDIARDVGDAVFVCHQCGQEFSAQAQSTGERQSESGLAQMDLAQPWQSISHGFAAPPWQRIDIFVPSVESEEMGATDIIADALRDDAEAMDSSQPQAAPSDRGDAMPVDEEQAPVRKTAHIWPWLLMILILLAGSGFWVQRDAWLDNRWFRSSLINIGFDMPLRAKDWRIAPASVSPEWVNRMDGSRILLVRGNIQNLLDSDMPLPKINMIFFSKTEPDKQIGSVVLDITLKPSDQQTQQMSYIAPAIDVRPVPALGHRGFTIVAQSVPEKTGDFTLTPAPR